MSRIISSIPNFITLLNLTSGVVAIIFALEGRLVTSALLIFAAALFDFLDGMAARLLKAYSDIGKELDSLADVVSFGVAPAIIYLGLMHKILAYGSSILPFTDISIVTWGFILTGLLIPVASALRLAKFNTDSRQISSFLGLPTPANAMLWAGLALIAAGSPHHLLVGELFTPAYLAALAVLTSLLLVSELPMFSLKVSNFSFAENWYRYLILALSLLLIVFTGIHAPALIVLTYIMLSMALYLLKVRV